MGTNTHTERHTARRAVLAGLATASTAGCLRSATTDDAAGASETGTVSGESTDSTTPAPSSESWPTFGADNGGRGTADVTAPGDELAQLWAVDIQSECGNPVIADGSVYVVGRTTIHAVDSATGEESWSFEIGLTDPISAAPTVVGDTMYATPGDGYVYALAAADGTLQWSEELTAGNGWTTVTPRRSGNHLVVGDEDRLAGTTRSAEGLEWSTTLDNTIVGLVADGEHAYVTTMRSDEADVYAIDPATGDEQWRYTGFRRPSLPAVSDGVVYAGGRGMVYTDGDGTALGPVCALDAGSGSEQWTAEVAAPIRTSPVVGSETIYVHDVSGMIHALDRAAGTVQWSEQVHSGGAVDQYPRQTGAPALVDDYLYVPAFDGRLIVVDPADGSTITSVELGDQLFCSPAVADGRVVVGNSDSKSSLFAVGVETA